MSALARQHVTTTGGRAATTRAIPPKLALGVGMPKVPAPEGWNWIPLTEIARLESGHTPTRKHPEYWGGDIPWISIQDAKANHGREINETAETINALGVENSSTRLLPAGTVCLSRTASVGYVVVMGRPMATSQDFVNWVCTKRLVPDFLKYLFIAEGDDLLRFSSGAVHPTIYFPEAKAFHVCIPSATNQRRIVRILDEVFESIAAAKVIAGRNAQYARAILESHFEIVFVRDSTGWVDSRLGDVVSRLTNGFVGPTRNIYRESGVPYLLARHVKNNYLLFDGKTFVTEEFNRKNSKSILNVGDVLLVQSGHIGHSAVVPKEHHGHNCHAMIVITPISTAVTGPFLSLCFNSPAMRRKFEEIRSGSTVPHLTCGAVKELRITLPDLHTQERIVEHAKELQKETVHLEAIYQRKLAALDELKKSLLHKAFAGEL